MSQNSQQEIIDLQLGAHNDVTPKTSSPSHFSGVNEDEDNRSNISRCSGNKSNRSYPSSVINVPHSHSQFSGPNGQTQSVPNYLGPNGNPNFSVPNTFYPSHGHPNFAVPNTFYAHPSAFGNPSSPNGHPNFSVPNAFYGSPPGFGNPQYQQQVITMHNFFLFFFYFYTNACFFYSKFNVLIK